MTWQDLGVAGDRTHHVFPGGKPAYTERFDNVLAFHDPGLAPVSRAGQAWHILPSGLPAYATRFRMTFGFYGGLAAVVDNDGWHHVLPSGEAAYAGRFDWCGNFQGFRCSVRDAGGGYWHIDEQGLPAYMERWRYAGDYREGFAVVQAPNGLSTHIDLNGRLLHGQWFNDLDVFHKGYARARGKDGWTHVDFDGLPVYSRRFAAVEPFYNGQARVERHDGAFEVIDEKGETLTEIRQPRWSEFTQLSSDMVGFWRTQTIGSAVRLGVPDVLPATEAAVAQRCGMKPDGTYRLLRALGELGLVISENGCWRLTPRGDFLRRDHPLTLADAALEYAGPFSKIWGELSRALTAASSWEAPDVFSEVAEDATRCAGHHQMLASYARNDYPQVVEALNLCAGDHVVDAGGGLGVLAQMALEKYPSVSVTVIDRPEVIALRRQLAPAPGIRWRQANVFDSWGVRADVVLLSRVLHDWDDADAIRVLERARESLAPGGRVYIIEMLIQEESMAGALCDLHLLMATGGRERSAQHYERLLIESGFNLAGVRHLAALPSIVAGVVS